MNPTVTANSADPTQDVFTGVANVATAIGGAVAQDYAVVNTPTNTLGISNNVFIVIVIGIVIFAALDLNKK